MKKAGIALAVVLLLLAGAVCASAVELTAGPVRAFDDNILSVSSEDGGRLKMLYKDCEDADDRTDGDYGERGNTADSSGLLPAVRTAVLPGREEPAEDRDCPFRSRELGGPYCA